MGLRLRLHAGQNTRNPVSEAYIRITGVSLKQLVNHCVKNGVGKTQFDTARPAVARSFLEGLPLDK